MTKGKSPSPFTRPGSHHFHPMTGHCFICGLQAEGVLGFKCIEPPYPATEERMKEYSAQFEQFWKAKARQ